MDSQLVNLDPLGVNQQLGTSQQPQEVSAVAPSPEEAALTSDVLTAPEDAQTSSSDASAQTGNEVAPKTKEEPTIGDYITDIAASPFRGVLAAAQGIYQLADWATFDNLPDWKTKFLGESKTGVGQFAEGAFEFAVGFIPVVGILGKASKIAELGMVGKALSNGFVRSTVAGAITDFSVFDAHQQRLSNLIQSVPSLQNPVTDYLSSKEGEGEIEGRLKNAIEGIGLGLATEGVFNGIKAVKKGLILKEAGKSPEEVMKAVEETAQPEKTIEAIKKSGAAEDAPEIAVKPANESSTSEAITKQTTEAVDQTTPSVKQIVPEDQIKLVEQDVDAINNRIEYPDTTDTTRIQSNLIKNTNSPLAVKQAQAAVEDVVRERLDAVLPPHTTLTQMDKDALSVIASLEGKTLDQKAAELAAIAKDSSSLPKAIRAAEIGTQWAFENFTKIREGIDISSPEGKQQHLESLQQLMSWFIPAMQLRRTAGQALNATRTVEVSFDTVAKSLLLHEGIDADVKKFIQATYFSRPEDAAALAGKQISAWGKFLKVHNEYWINAMLGTKSFTVNTLGNTVSTLMLPAEGYLGSITKDPQLAKSFAMRYRYAWDSIGDAWKMAKQSWIQQQNMIGHAVDDSGSKGAISAAELGVNADSGLADLVNWLGNVTRIPTRALGATDNFFKVINFNAAAKSKLYYEALQDASIKDNPEAIAKYVSDKFNGLLDQSGKIYSEAGIRKQALDEAKAKGITPFDVEAYVDDYVAKNYDPNKSLLADYAKDVMEEATFTKAQDPNSIGGLVQMGVNKLPALRLVMPFVSTPMNMIKFVAQRTLPADVPVLRSLHKQYMSDVMSQDVARAAAARGRFAMGSAIYAVAGAAALNGTITGFGSRNPREREAMIATGWQPYSIKVGDKYIAYNRLDPVSSFLGIVADAADVMKRGQDEDQEALNTVWTAAVLSLANNVTNKTYLAGLAQAVDVLTDPDRNAARFLRARAASYIPNTIGQSVGTISGDMEMKEVRSLQDALFRRLPILSENVDPTRNGLGEIVDTQMFSGRRLVDWVNPFSISTKKDDAVLNEIASLGHGFSQPKQKLGDVIDLTSFTTKEGRTAYDRWLELHGTTDIGGKSLREALQDVINSPSYQSLDKSSSTIYDSPRAALLNRVINRYRHTALQQLFREFPEVNSKYQQLFENQRALKMGASLQNLAKITN